MESILLTILPIAIIFLIAEKVLVLILLAAGIYKKECLSKGEFSFDLFFPFGLILRTVFERFKEL